MSWSSSCNASTMAGAYTVLPLVRMALKWSPCTSTSRYAAGDGGRPSSSERSTWLCSRGTNSSPANNGQGGYRRQTVGCDGAGCHHSIGLVGRSSWNRCPFSSLLTSHPSALSLAPSRNVLSRTRSSRRYIGERDGVEQARLHERAVEEGEGGFQSTHQRPPPAPHCERATVWDTRHSASVPSAPTVSSLSCKRNHQRR